MIITKPDGKMIDIKLDIIHPKYEQQRITLDDNSYIEIEHFKTPEQWNIAWIACDETEELEVLDATTVNTETKAIDWINNLLNVIPCKIPD